MKKLFLIILSVLIANVFSQKMLVNTKDGSSTSFDLINVDNITFELGSIPDTSYLFDTTEFARHSSAYNYAPGTNDFAYGVWLKVVGDNVGRFMDTHNTDNWYSDRFGLFVQPENVMSITNEGTSDNRVKLTSKTKISKNVWYHIVCARRSNVMYMYINGVLDTSIANSNNIGSSGYMTLGGSAYNNYGYRCGDVVAAHVFVVDGTLQDSDVSDLYNGIKTPLEVGSECKGWWKFNEGTGTTVNDASGFGVNLTLDKGTNWQIK